MGQLVIVPVSPYTHPDQHPSRSRKCEGIAGLGVTSIPPFPLGMGQGKQVSDKRKGTPRPGYYPGLGGGGNPNLKIKINMKMNNYELLLTILLFIVVNNFFIYLIHSNYFNKCIKALYIYTVSYKYFLNPVFSHKIFNLYTSSIILFFSISNLEEIYSLNLCHMSYAPPIANAVTSLHE